MNLPKLFALSTDKRALVDKLQEWKIIPEESKYLCKKCGGKLTIGKNERAHEGYMWVCRNYFLKSRKRIRCNNQVSLRTGTFFEQSHLTLLQILMFVFMWVDNIPINFIMKNVEITAVTAADWSSFCREAVFATFVEKREPLGGPGKVVEIDKSKFAHSKCNRGAEIRDQWVFGGYERGTGRVFMVAVEDRTRETLIPLIKKWVLPGTTIMSDCWKSYDCLEKEGYKHYKVNHSVSFKDPVTGAHTNSIGSSWRAAKCVVNEPGRKKNNIPGNLAKYMFQKRCKELGADPFFEFLKLAGKLFNPMSQPVDSRPVFGQRDTEDEDEDYVEDST